MSTDAATPETPARPETDGVDGPVDVAGSAGDGAASDDPADDRAGDQTDDTARNDVTATDTPPESATADGDVAAETTETTGTTGATGEQDAPAASVTPIPDVPAQAAPDHDADTDKGADQDTSGATGGHPGGDPEIGPVPDDAGGRLTARLREARARLQPEQTVIPAPRTPEGVVPPVPFGRGGGAPPADLLRAVDRLAAQLAELEQEHDGEDAPDRLALVRALDRSAAGVPDGGWSAQDALDGESLADAADLAGTLHDEAVALVDRLDAEDRPGPAAEVGGVVTALQVARVVLDLEAFARHAR